MAGCKTDFLCTLDYKNKILLKSLSLLAGTGDVDTVDKAYCLKVSLLYINFLLCGRQLQQKYISLWCKTWNGPRRIFSVIFLPGLVGTAKKWEQFNRLPSPITVREALTRYLDITTVPSPQFIKFLALKVNFFFSY